MKIKKIIHFLEHSAKTESLNHCCLHKIKGILFDLPPTPIRNSIEKMKFFSRTLGIRSYTPLDEAYSTTHSVK